jgi:hypothetical protein
VTPNWNPGGTASGVYDNHPLGVYYVTSAHKWAIFNQDLVAMPVNAAFNVRSEPTLTSATACVYTAATVSNNTTTPTCGVGASPSPASAIFVTANWNSPGSDVYVKAPLGVYHAGNTWRIFREDQVAFPVNATINVSTNGGATATFVDTASAGNTSFNYTVIDNPASNGNPNALLSVTQNWNPGSAGGVYNVNNIGVWYVHALGKWAIFNQNTAAAIPVGAAFNVGVA